MDGTAVGNVFTSPSADDVLNVARALGGEQGVLIIGGNYAGDRMNFDIARDQLREGGVAAGTFYITDDVSSAPAHEAAKRRGNVGTFCVFKAVGAAAAEGRTLEECLSVAEHANNRTRTMSVGFRGCTLPGDVEPLFRVPEGMMEVGQGIHGEPGVGEESLASASVVARLLVDRVLAEAPSDASGRLAVILDGLGSTKYEELFVVWGTVRDLLEEEGYTLIEPLVGEYVTSLDMEGIALAVEFLDDDLERLWLAPCDTPAFRRGVSSVKKGERVKYASHENTLIKQYEEGTPVARLAAKQVVDCFGLMKAALAEAEPELARIDGVSGDGDHGRGMVKGVTYAFEAASDALEHGAAVGSVLREAGRAWAAKAGGTSGVLWGSALEAASEVIGDQPTVMDTALVSCAARAACDKMISMGGAQLGDKTMIDALSPFCDELVAQGLKGSPLLAAWTCAAEVASRAAEDTSKLLPKVGRARPAAERSLGTPDAGAISLALCARAVLSVGK